MTDVKREEYIDLAIRTEAPITPELVERMTGHARSIHAIFGLITETGELTDGFKRAIFYGKPLDITNVREELGDFFWYIAILMDEFGFSFEEVMKLNIQKLLARFPEKFTEVDALNRNLLNERQVLEGVQVSEGVTFKNVGDSQFLSQIQDNQFLRRVQATGDLGCIVIKIDGKQTTLQETDAIAMIINASPSIGRIFNLLIEGLRKEEKPNEEGHGPSQEI